jgi:hypothetical protein
MENEVHILSCCFKRLRFRETSEPAVSAEPQSIENTDGEQDKPESSFYNLAASNPHIIAATILFSKKSK